MLRVVWIVPGFSSDESDWCIPALLDLARELARRCRLTIVAMRYPYRRDVYRIGGATVCSIGGGHRGPAYTPGIWRDTFRAIQGIPSDLLHAFWAYEPGLIASWFSSRMPVVISLAGGELISLPEIRYGLGVKLNTRIPVRWALRRARIVTAGSRYLMKLADQQLPQVALRLQPLGVDLRRWPYPRQEPDSPVIINVGALEPVKGQAILLQAFQRVHLQMPSARLRIVGVGRMLDELARMAADLHLSPYVRFAGPIPHHELSACYAGSSIFVQSSWHEAQGMALLEAAACGLPIAGTSVGALADFTPGAAVGVPVGEAEPLAEAVLKLLTRGEDAGALGVQSRKRVEAEYTLESSAERFLQLYQSIR